VTELTLACLGIQTSTIAHKADRRDMKTMATDEFNLLECIKLFLFQIKCYVGVGRLGQRQNEKDDNR
jgi:hypothetical protein